MARLLKPRTCPWHSCQVAPHFKYAHHKRSPLDTTEVEPWSRSDIYTPLDPKKTEIRVLQLYPGTGSQELAGNLTVRTLPSASDPVRVLSRASQLLARYDRLRASVIRGYLSLDELKLERASALLKHSPVETHLRDLVSEFHNEDHKRKAAEFYNCALSPGNPPLTNVEEVAHPEFDAVSYCWKDPNQKSPMRLNGKLLLVPTSATNVLRNFRSQGRDQWLWIDALCIDQENVSEREDQVSKMREIYTTAARTRIWLGEDDSNTEAAFRICESTGTYIMERCRAVHPRKLLETMKELIATMPMPLGAPPELVATALISIFSRRWFTRMWVYQEARLSSNCFYYCGSKCVPWSHISLTALLCIDALLASISSWADQTSSLTQQSEAAVISAFNGISFAYEHLNMHLGVDRLATNWRQSLDSTQRLEARDVRDKVYALLSTVTGQGDDREHRLRAGLRPNYHATLRESMLSATRAMIEDEVDLNEWPLDIIAINADRYPRDMESQWPSWVLRFESQTDGIMQGFSASHSADDNHPLSTARMTRLHCADSIFLKGHMIGQVRTSVALGFTTLQSWRALYQSLAPLRLASWNITPAMLTSTLHALTVCGGFADRDFDAHHYDDHLLTDGKRHLLSGTTIDDLVNQLRSRIERPRVEDGVSRMHARRSWFVLTDAHGHQIGLGPRATQQDDVVAIVYGSRWPWVLRPQQGQDYYTVVGPCFVDGLMSGEYVQRILANAGEAEEFELR